MSAGNANPRPLDRHPAAAAMAPARPRSPRATAVGTRGHASPRQARHADPRLSRRLLRWILSFAAVGYGMSILLHAVALAFLSLIVMKATEEEGSFTTTILESDDSVTEFVEVIDTRMDVSGMQSEPVQAPQLTTPEPVAKLTEPVLSSDLINAPAAADGEGTGDANSSSDVGGGIPRGRNAVTKGSFTAWTVPDDPEPFKPYYIVIEVKLPDGTRRYPVSDLKGMLVGTDNWRQTIPWDARDPLATRVQRRGRVVSINMKDHVPIKEGRAQVLIRVQAADPDVEDKIQIESRMLNEAQNLMIKF